MAIANAGLLLDHLVTMHAAKPKTPIKITSSIEGAEGPCSSKDGAVYCVEPPSGTIYKVDCLGGSAEFYANTGGIPAGLQIDREGRLFVADMKLGILCVPAQSEVIDVIRTFHGEPIRGCNDLIFDSNGVLYFTAPAGSSGTNSCGQVFSYTVSGELRLLDEGFAFCNGIAISADDTTLIVAETWTKNLWAYDILSPGTVSNRRLFATVSGTHQGGPDGMDFDESGNLIVANWGSGKLEIFSPDGKPVNEIVLPFDKPSNVHFASADSTVLLVTEHTTNGIWSLDYGKHGQMQYGWI